MTVPAKADPVGTSNARPRVGYLVFRLQRRLQARLDDALRAHDVTTTDYITLSVLRSRDGLSGAELARWAFVTPQAMNLVISSLERRRLIRRTPDPSHRRILRASVTAAGLRVLEFCDQSMDEIEGDMLAGLATDTLDTVRGALASCARSLDGSQPLATPRPLTRAKR